MPEPVARFQGYTQLIASLRSLPRAQEAMIREEFRAIGRVLATRWAEKIATLNPPGTTRTVEGYRPYVRLRGLEVDQTVRKTTGLRPDWGKTQMVRGGIPVLEETEPEIVAGIDEAMTKAQKSVGL